MRSGRGVRVDVNSPGGGACVAVQGSRSEESTKVASTYAMACDAVRTLLSARAAAIVGRAEPKVLQQFSDATFISTSRPGGVSVSTTA